MSKVIPWPAAAACLLAICVQSPCLAQTSAPALRWIDKVARGDKVEAEDATRQLVAQLVDPLAESIGSMNERPVAEQLRLRELIARLNSALRARLARNNFERPERELFDRFDAAFPELVTQLFHDDWRVRVRALQAIPLEPGSGAGVMLLAKIDDSDGEVASAALEIARKFHDETVVRGLVRFVRAVSEAIRSGVYGPDDLEIQVALTDFARQAIEILGTTGSPEATAAVLESMKTFIRSPLKEYFPLGDMVTVLGQLKDRRARPMLEEVLDFPGLRRGWPSRDDKYVTQTTGDAALLALVRIYDLDMKDFGLVVASGAEGYAGYPSAAAREAGHRAMRTWLAGHVDDASLAPASDGQASQSRPAK